VSKGIRCHLASVDTKRDLFIKTPFTTKDDVVWFLKNAGISPYKSLTAFHDNNGAFSGDCHLTFENHEDAYQAKRILEQKTTNSRTFRNITINWTRPMSGILKRLEKERQELLEENAKLVDLVRKKVSLADLLEDKAPVKDFRLSCVLFTHINKVLEIAGFNRHEASRLLGITPSKLSSIINQLKQEGYKFPKLYNQRPVSSSLRPVTNQMPSGVTQNKIEQVDNEEDADETDDNSDEITWKKGGGEDVERVPLRAEKTSSQRRRRAAAVRNVGTGSHSATKMFEPHFVSK
jgi:predicted XRE-type DNA-binding protein